jgi:putative NADPH-quinone reductase/1,4-dihydroxy-2-naphthoate octaprenyltransferase
MNVLIINGHPRRGSFSEALTDAYFEGAAAAGVNITKLTLANLSFNPNVTHISPCDQLFEDDIKQSQGLIKWAHHIVFVYPTWWGTMPALLKGFIDRVFTADFAFEDIEGGTGYAPLLRGKTAQIITTMDTPKWVYRFIYRSPGHNAVRRATLQFCGFDMAPTISFGPVKNSTKAVREQWLIKTKNEGLKLHRGALSPLNKVGIKTMAWLKAMRLQFYPMTFVAYTTGALGAQSLGYALEKPVFWLGYLWLFLIEIATVLTNDYYDFNSDKQNKYFSPFTGGSRVIVDKLLSFAEIRKGIFISLALSFVVLALLLVNISASLPAVLLICGILFVLALGYTVPPLRLSYRALGEIDVGLTHSFAVVVCGYIFQGGSIDDAFPWLLSLPMFFAALPSIIMSGIPDYDADKAASKETLAVKFGKKGAAALAIGFTLLTAITVIIFKLYNIIPKATGNLVYAVIPHAALLITLVYKYIKNPSPSFRIDSLMIASLTYLIWLGLIPLINLY